MSDIYDQDAYRRFHENLQPLLNGPNIEHAKLRDLKERALQTATRTRFGSHGWRSAVSSRIAPRTVYLGSEPVRLPSPTDLQKGIIEKAPDELHSVLHMMRTLPFVHLRRQMGDNSEYNPICNLYVSAADLKNLRLAYMWGHTMRKPDNKPGPEFTLIHIPDEHHLRQQVLTIPEYNLNIVLGSDYMGEDKKGFLRQAMYSADLKGMLGLHAGTKVVTARDSRDGKLKRHGIFIFGLSATGKSTWSCHQLGLNEKDGEGTEVGQDDIVFLKRDGSAFGSEVGFFVKTDVDPSLQEAMYNALVHKSALYENVMIDAKGNPDFLDETLCANGRAVIDKDELKVRRGRRLVGISAKSIDLPSLEELDGLQFAFITRRNTIMPFAQELTAEQAALAYLWGESSHSYASQPAKAGESVRIVGTDPFIVGSRAKKTNQFYEIIMDLVDRYGDKVKFLQYNTGGVGEIIETYTENGAKKKRQVRKVSRVPIDLMAAIQRGDFRGTNKYERGRLGTREIVHVEGGLDLSPYDPAKLYSHEQIDDYVRDLVAGRRKFTDEIAAEGLKPEILEAAERSFQIAKDDRKLAAVQQQQAEAYDEPDEWIDTGEYESRSRLPRDRGWRWR
jgi:phosphoenolpyruvate carboxykinase (ATP)